MQHGEQRATEEPASIVQLDRHKVFHAGIALATVERTSVPLPLTVPGRVAIDEHRWVHITARVGGRVEKLTVVTNDEVREGEIVAELYSQEFLAMQFEFLQAVERCSRARQAGGGELEGALAIEGAARRKLQAIGLTAGELSELERTRVTQTYYHVRAPLTGIVLASSVRRGSFLQPGAELFEVADLSTVWVLADIYESDLGRIPSSTKVNVTTRAYADTFPGMLTSIYSLVDEKTRTVKGRVEVRNERRLLKPDMFCTVLVNTELGKNVMRIPASALFGETEHHFVFVGVNDTTFEKRDIRTGMETREFAEVVDGLREQEQIVVKGGFFLKSELAKETFSEGD